MKRTIIAVVTGLIVASGAAAFYKWHSDEAAWNTVRAALVRVESGLQYESVIQLRSHLADADAALEMFDSTRRVFPRDHAERIAKAKQALIYLSDGIDWQLKAASTNTVTNLEDFQEIQQYPDVATFLRRSCRGGGIFAVTGDLSAAFVERGTGLLIAAERDDGVNPSPKGTSSPLSFEAETLDCQRQFASDQKKAEKKYWAQFAYRVDLTLDNTAPGPCLCYTSIDGDGAASTKFAPGDTVSFGVRHSMNIPLVNCYNGGIPKTLFKATINGKPAQPQWGNTSAMIIGN